ncbi:MAG TPA: BlaI/MecI/CopY family transcriptional regulator [Candidatus Bathyarchaeia archaeon]|nr:BlaI/MecI/CopY family transcriptional regulator [Candidatus Bathyarchaeia archaeon]
MKLQVLHPTNRDLRFALGDLEAIVLQRLWETDKSLSVKEFQRKISRSRPVAVTTVATILDRLYRKGIVARQLIKEGGPHYVYSARVTEDQFKHVVVHNVMGALLRGFNDVTVAYLTDRMADGPEDRKVISKYLKRLKDKAKE